MNTKENNNDVMDVYVGTYAKYNDGNLSGAWLNIGDYPTKKEFIDAYRKLHSDEKEPELMFQDYENIPCGLIDECWISDNLFNLVSATKELDDEEQRAFWSWLNITSQDTKEDADTLVERFRDAFEGAYDSEQDFACHLVDENYDLDKIMGNLSIYFDYEAFARDLFLGDYVFDGEFVFIMI